MINSTIIHQVKALSDMRATSWLKRYSTLLWVGGSLAVMWHNWRRWRQDKVLLAAYQQPVPIPPLIWWPELPLVSVLVAAWNEAERIEQHIEHFSALRYPHKELILCAGGQDGCYEQALAYTTSQVRVFRQQAGEGKQKALHRCLPYAQGSIVFLTDADCLLDNEAFERTLYPVVVGSTQVCTGSSQPDATQFDNSFVVAQVASQIYGDLHAPTYGEGLLGRNCAVTRRLLEESGGLAAPAATGTDYVLAKMLLRQGAKIRQVPKSRVVTSYPTRIGSYLRQQRRWVRNVALHGLRFKAFGEVKASLTSSLVGLIMLVLPFLSLIGRKDALFVWWLLLWHGFLSRVRYLYVLKALFGIPIPLKQLMAQPIMLLLDCIAWSQPLLDYLLPEKRKEW